MNDPVVLLMTDIVDSTQLTERLGPAAADLWAAHDRCAWQLMHRRGGHVLQRGDGFLMRFDRIDDAVEFAIDYHAEIGRLAHSLRARAGIHVGPLDIRTSDGDVGGRAGLETLAGVAIPTAARIMALAAGGQTLLSSEARARLNGTSRRMQSHGHWRLKGIEEPVEVFEIGGDEAPFSPPVDAPKAYRVVMRHDVWLPRRDVPHSLPAERNSFVGRKAHLDELRRRLDGEARLVSVVGTGGTGKTRLVQRFGWRHLGDFDGGVWYCDLSQAVSFDGLCLAVAQGLGIPLGKTEPVEQLGHAIAGHGTCLVVLDNFEQVAEHAQKTLGRWLDRAPDARFVVTTRVVLGLDGEEVMTLPPLRQVEAVDLFTQRASAVQRDFATSNADATTLRTLVDLLDGLPLAIELAAARIRVFGLTNLVARMRDRFKLLTAGTGRPSRQATLRAAFDWSWDLLSDVDKSGLAQLSVFEGGFSVDSAEAVLAFDEGIGRVDVADVLQSLLDKSWISQTQPDRFALLKTIQEYAAEQLDTDDRFPGSGVRTRMSAEQRHWDYFGGLDEVTATTGRCVEIDNLVAAARRAAARMEPHAAVETLCSTWYALKLCGPYRIAIGLSADALAVPGLAGPDRASAQLVLGNALHYCGKVVEASACYELALDIARDSGSRLQLARTLCAMGEQHNTATRHDEARATLTEALAVAQELGDQRLQCATLNALGNLHLNLSELRQAQERYEAALSLARRMGDLRWEGGLLGNLGGVHHALGRTDEAQRYYEQAIQRAQEIGDKRWESNARSNLGLLLSETGRVDEAKPELEHAMASARALGHVRLECIVALNLGMVCEKRGDNEAARTNYERALRIAEELGDHRTEGQALGSFGLFLVRLGEVDEGMRCFDRGRKLLDISGDQISLAALLIQKAEAGLSTPDRRSAIDNIDSAARLVETLDLPKHSPLINEIRRVQEAIRRST